MLVDFSTHLDDKQPEFIMIKLDYAIAEKGNQVIEGTTPLLPLYVPFSLTS